jgi:hypothetical protein
LDVESLVLDVSKSVPWESPEIAQRGKADIGEGLNVPRNKSMCEMPINPIL